MGALALVADEDRGEGVLGAEMFDRRGEAGGGPRLELHVGEAGGGADDVAAAGDAEFFF